MRNFGRVGRLWVGVGVALVLTGAAGASDLAGRRDLLTQVGLFYGEQILFGPAAQPRGVQVLPDVNSQSPGYVVAALSGGGNIEVAGQVLAAVLATQDRTPKSPTLGLFPSRQLGGTPELEATCRILPLLAWIAQHDARLPEALRLQVDGALALAYEAVAKAKVPAEAGALTLVRAAALATAGPALRHPEGVAAAQGIVKAWLRRALEWGCASGHGPGMEAVQVGALNWVAAAGGVFPELEQAQRLLLLDMVQRVQPGSGALAGAVTAAEPGDYAEGGELHRYLLFLANLGTPPVVVRPSAMYFAACEYAPEEVAEVTLPTLPRLVTTLAKDQDPKRPAAITRTDTYLTDLFSLGTMTGPLGQRSLPVRLTLAGQDNPSVYFYASCIPARVTSVQRENLAAVSVNFLAAGAAEAPQAYLRGVFGRRGEIRGIRMNTSVWPDPQPPAAVAQGSVVAVERDGVFIGVRLMLCGAALPAQRVGGAKPGVLQWRGEGANEELELLVYARKQTYPLPRPEPNQLAGVLVSVAPATAYESLEEFSKALLSGRLRQSVSFAKELIKPPVDPAHELLHPTEPHFKVDYKVIPHLYHDLTYQSGDLSLYLKEDLVGGQVLAREANGVALPAAGPWQSPLLSLPWDARVARASLTGQAH